MVKAYLPQVSAHSGTHEHPPFLALLTNKGMSPRPISCHRSILGILSLTRPCSAGQGQAGREELADSQSPGLLLMGLCSPAQVHRARLHWLVIPWNDTLIRAEGWGTPS